MPWYWNICHDNDQCGYYKCILSCKKTIPPTPPPTSRFPGWEDVSQDSKVTEDFSDFVAWQENCSVTSEKRFLSGSVIPRLCLHTCINPVSNFDLIYQLRYILLGINDIYEDLWKEYQSEMINEAQFVNRCNETLQRPVFHGMSYNTVELFLSLMKLWKLRPLFPYWNDRNFDTISSSKQKCPTLKI